MQPAQAFGCCRWCRAGISGLLPTKVQNVTKPELRPLYFVASYPRSGNTWVRAFFFALMRETGSLVSIMSDLKNIDDLLPWDIVPRFVGSAIGRGTEFMTLRDMAEARPKVHRWFAEHFYVRPIIKSHAMFAVIHGHNTFPTDLAWEATYLIRNPLEVAPSLAKLRGWTIPHAIDVMATRSLTIGAHKGGAPEPWGNWSQNVISWMTTPKRVPIMRFEDFIASPTKQFEALANHAGFQATRSQIADAVAAVSLEQLEKLERAPGFRSPSRNPEAFFGGGVRQRYTDKLSPEQARSIIGSHAVLMNKFGYLDDEALRYAGIGRDEALTSSRAFLIREEKKD